MRNSFHTLIYKNYILLFKSIKKVLENDATPLNKRDFLSKWDNDKKFRDNWSNFIFFVQLKCPDCAADLGLSIKKGILTLKFIKHNC